MNVITAGGMYKTTACVILMPEVSDVDADNVQLHNS